MKKTVITTLILLFAISTLNAQFFKKSDEEVNLADEFADVLFVLVCLANQTGIDLTEAFHKNMAKKTGRDKERHANNPKLKS